MSTKPTSHWTLIKLMDFIHELRHLLSSGLPLLTALELMQMHLNKKSEADLAQQLNQKISRGSSFALAWHDLTQEKLSFALLNAAEASGLLHEMLEHIETYAKAQKTWKHLFWQALRYPLFLFILTFILLLALCTWVIPEFSALYAGFNAKLPWLTEVIINISVQVQEKIFAITLVLSVLGVLFFIFRHNKKVYPLISLVKQQFHFYRHFQALQFWHAVSLLLQAGIPLNQALTLCQKMIRLQIMQTQIQHIILQIHHGEKLSVALKKQKHTSKKIIAIIALAEASGALAGPLYTYTTEEMARMQEKIQQIKVWLEPVFLCIIGSIIALVLIALYLPIVQLGQWV